MLASFVKKVKKKVKKNILSSLSIIVIHYNKRWNDRIAHILLEESIRNDLSECQQSDLTIACANVSCRHLSYWTSNARCFTIYITKCNYSCQGKFDLLEVSFTDKIGYNYKLLMIITASDNVFVIFSVALRRINER